LATVIEEFVGVALTGGREATLTVGVPILALTVPATCRGLLTTVTGTLGGGGEAIRELM
jgi:hypothetical protein